MSDFLEINYDKNLSRLVSGFFESYDLIREHLYRKLEWHIPDEKRSGFRAIVYFWEKVAYLYFLSRGLKTYVSQDLYEQLITQVFKDIAREDQEGIDDRLSGMVESFTPEEHKEARRYLLEKLGEELYQHCPELQEDDVDVAFYTVLIMKQFAAYVALFSIMDLPGEAAKALNVVDNCVDKMKGLVFPHIKPVQPE